MRHNVKTRIVKQKKKNAPELGNNLSGSRSILRSIFVALAFIALYRFGCYITVPFINVSALNEVMSKYTSGTGILSMFNTMSGGSIGRMSIFSLTVVPYISASIIMQIMSYGYQSLRDIQQSPNGALRILFYTRLLAFAIALFQGYGMSFIPISMNSNGSEILYTDNIALFQFVAVLTFATGSMILIWIGDSITKCGIGSGISIVIYTGIIANMPYGLGYFFDMLSSGSIPTEIGLLIMIVFISLVSLSVVCESSHRVIDLQYPGNRLSALQGSSISPSLPIKFNICGVMPAIFASVLVGVPSVILSYIGPVNNFMSYLSIFFNPGAFGYSILFATLIVLFAFYYLPIAFKTDNVAQMLKLRGAFIPGYRPGKGTVDFLDSIVKKLAVFGACYLIILCVIPQLFLSNLPGYIYINGTSILIAVSVSLDLMQNIYSNVIMQRYGKMMKN